MSVKKPKRRPIKTRRTPKSARPIKNKEKDTQQFIMVLIVGLFLLALFIYLMNK